MTGGCATYEVWVAFLGGLVAPMIFTGFSVLLRKMKIDDPLEAAPMHAGCGMWGQILTGLLAKPEFVKQVYGLNNYSGVFYTEVSTKHGSRGRLLGAQLIQIVVIFAWTCGLMAPFFLIMRALKLHRVSEHEEQVGLDVSKHGGAAYIDDKDALKGTA